MLQNIAIQYLRGYQGKPMSAWVKKVLLHIRNIRKVNMTEK